MSDINFMDMFFDHENLLSSYDKDGLKKNKKNEKQDDEHFGWISDDFLNSILKSVDDNVPLFDQLLNNGSGLLNESHNDCSSDSGLSGEQSFSPTRTDDTLEDVAFSSADDRKQSDESDKIELDCEVSDIIIEEPPFDAVEYVKEEVIECEEIPFSISFIDPEANSMSEIYIIADDTKVEDDEFNENEFVELDDSVLLTYPKLQTVKILNSNSKSGTNSKNSDELLTANQEDFGSEGASDDSDFVYPRLQLTPEEQKLAAKERIKLPSHYPLNKLEERELKRIRRKIRNKISAQDSRRRKKEYVDRLEERMKKCSEENIYLMKRIKSLQSQNVSLIAQVRKLQASLARFSSQTAQPSTCLLVLIMSLALVLAPTIRNKSMQSENNEDEGISLKEDDNSAAALNSVGRSRNLLFSHKNHDNQCNIDEETKALTEQLEKMQVPNANMLSGLLEMLKLKLGKDSILLKDHDYFRPRKRPASNPINDESWLPAKIAATEIGYTSEGLTNTIVVDKMNKSNITGRKEPPVIELLSD